MRDGIRLKGERGGDPVLILAQHVRDRSPTSCDLFVLEQAESDRGKQDKQCRHQPGDVTNVHKKKQNRAREQEDELVRSREKLEAEAEA